MSAHNNAKTGDIAKTVLMPGDPLRAKFIAENYLENPVCYNEVRGMFGYTGTYRGKRISVQGSGMGIPSMAIYSYELYHEYDVDNIIRIGTAGSLSDKVNLRDIIIATTASTNSAFAGQYNLGGTFSPSADFSLLSKAVSSAEKLSLKYHVGSILSSDNFYDEGEGLKKWAEMGVLAVEMETYALYTNAMRAGKNALCILTVSDCPFRGLSTSPEERQTSFRDMMETALETALNI